MNLSRFLLLSVLVVSLFSSCIKDDDSPSAPSFSITNVSPATLYTNSTVTITGSNFGTDISRVTVLLDSLVIVPTEVTNEKIVFTITSQQAKPGQRTLTVKIEGKESQSGSVKITLLEPAHGWFYAATIPNPKDNRTPECRLITFPTDSIGYVQREKYLFRSMDGGLTWTGNDYDVDGHLGFGFAFYSSDGKNAWIENGVNVGVSTDYGANWTFNNLSTGSYVAGLYMTSPSSGLVATQFGQLLSVQGGFGPSNVTAIFRSQWATIRSALYWQKLSVANENNVMVAGKLNPPDAPNTTTLTVVHGKNGVFSEYDFRYLTNSDTVKALQLINENTAFITDRENNILKMNGAMNWNKLTQKATTIHFLNSNTGYAAYNGKILKTTDGGATWQDEFTLRPGLTINSICSKNGKIWAVGNESTQGVILKYNP